MTRRTFFPAIITSVLLINSSAIAQAKQDSREPKVDTTHVHSISVADLEMIDPENRLIPESNEEIEQWSFENYVESPLSSAKTAPPAKSQSKLTTQDLRALENISTPKKQQAAGTPSR